MHTLPSLEKQTKEHHEFEASLSNIKSSRLARLSLKNQIEGGEGEREGRRERKKEKKRMERGRKRKKELREGRLSPICQWLWNFWISDSISALKKYWSDLIVTEIPLQLTQGGLGDGSSRGMFVMQAYGPGRIFSALGDRDRKIPRAYCPLPHPDNSVRECIKIWDGDQQRMTPNADLCPPQVHT